MTNQQHPITPPPELVEQWLRERPENEFAHSYITTQAARWGADQELEACCHLLRQQGFDVVDDLRATRRPKPPSLKERALKALDDISIASFEQDAANTIRRALEALPE